MKYDEEMMGAFKRLNRVNKEGGSMTSEERKWFEHTKKKSEKLEAQAKASISTGESNSIDFF